MNICSSLPLAIIKLTKKQNTKKGFDKMHSEAQKQV